MEARCRRSLPVVDRIIAYVQSIACSHIHAMQSVFENIWRGFIRPGFTGNNHFFKPSKHSELIQDEPKPSVEIRNHPQPVFLSKSCKDIGCSGAKLPDTGLHKMAVNFLETEAQIQPPVLGPGKSKKHALLIRATIPLSRIRTLFDGRPGRALPQTERKALLSVSSSRAIPCRSATMR